MTIRILGVNFRTDGPSLPESLCGAGLVVVPSGPGLACDLLRSEMYRQALRNAEWVVPDSGLMVLVWNLLNRHWPDRRIERYSGLRLLREVLPRSDIQAPGVTFWIMPSVEDQSRNLEWLRGHGFSHLSPEDCYVAPFYQPAADGEVVDERLLDILERRRPKVIFVNVGGGTQEQLGWYLRSRLSYRPGIVCTGAAIAFLTGGQAAIPPWADRLYLGWLLRILRDPVRFGRRYLASIRLVPLLLRYRERSPVEKK